MDNSGPLSTEEYYSLKRLARLRYRLKYEPRRIIDLSLIFISIFIEWLGNTLLAPITPWYIDKLASGMDEGAAASILMASYAVGTFLSSLFTGPLSDRYGRRPVFILAMFLYTISYFLVANAWNIASFAGFRAIGGVSAGTRPVLYAFITDSSRVEDMRFYGSCISICNTVGGALGPTIGGWLASVGISFPFYFMGVLAAILFLLQLFFLRETKPREDKPEWLKWEYYECWKHQHQQQQGRDQANDVSSSDNLPPPLPPSGSIDAPPKGMSPMDEAKDMGLGAWSKKNKWFITTLVCLCLAAFAGQYAGNSWATVFGVLGADRYDLTEQQNGEAMGIQALVVIICTILYMYISNKIKPGLVAAFGFCLVVLAVIVPFIYSIWGTIIIGMCVYVGITFFFAGMAYCSALISPPKSRGLINSITMGVTNVGKPISDGGPCCLLIPPPIHRWCAGPSSRRSTI
ncbi:hypothetical protein Pmar_PMAR022254 [Perkinsus marinus ATCC 50983]|uniref:Major facilitator superfamily (MFS) profile domain-containing protein n=1 Tax=Perkinsus marinus (strain ATCC 50983 / TXsc) TaxID=423536 RepID=C5KDL6_PERM5|nr:hypothetical protein Pmar_PMAR022254 [Perkinsus marinus ATCC 50983]EER17319.1 hypothetical protein Pmar_PMAR022254 [Perkinsus marinus ATCC 50983]|eukprot:XP_002785523.1 hypothetical protein Pmar_PMAR022254 [Perkinsus marinus ATCC 50983]